MQYLVNGEVTDLPKNPEGISVVALPNKVAVRTPEGSFTAVIRSYGGKTFVSYRGRVFEVEPAARAKTRNSASNGEMKAPMPGLIIDVLVTKGQAVQAGDKLLVLEAMKTQQPFLAPMDGTVTELNVEVGQQVNEGLLLIKVSGTENTSP